MTEVPSRTDWRLPDMRAAFVYGQITRVTHGAREAPSGLTEIEAAAWVEGWDDADTQIEADSK